MNQDNLDIRAVKSRNSPFPVVRLPIVLMILYFWWLICTPYTRFPILGDIYFEKILAALWLISIFLQRRKPPLWSGITKLLIALFLLLTVLSHTSWLPDTVATLHWRENYWKVILFYAMAVLSIRDRADFLHAISGIVLIVYGYQVLSWRDFLAGGSYVYQQGIRRMIGMWVENSYGAGNYWGSLSTFTVPFAFYCFRRWKNPWARASIFPLTIMLVLSTVYSGSRGSLVTLIAFFLFANRSRLWHPKYLLSLIAIAALVFSFMPDDYKKRYSMIIVDKEDIHTGTKDEQNAKASAASRLQGLIDGWRIMVEHPQGTGPVQSPVARMDVNPELAAGGEQFQLHNLFGQILSETGVLGSLLVLLIWLKMYRFLADQKSPVGKDLASEKEAILGALVIMLVYGMANHSLYSYWWIWLYAFSTALMTFADQYGKDANHTLITREA